MSGSRETPEEQRHRAFMEAREAERKANEAYVEAQGQAGEIQREILDIARKLVADDPEKLRDWFAGQALAGMAGTVNWWDASGHEGAARACYQIADAMLKEREADHA